MSTQPLTFPKNTSVPKTIYILLLQTFEQQSILHNII